MFVDKPFKEATRSHSIDVTKSCGKDHNGYWWCVDCAEGLRNNFEALTHDKEHPKHRIVWHCGQHGFETRT